MSLREFLPVSPAVRRPGDGENRFRFAEPGLVPDFSVGRAGTPNGAGAGVRETSRPAAAPAAAAESPLPGPMAAPAAPAVPGTRAAGEIPATSRRRGEGLRAGRRLPAWMEQVVLLFVRPGNRRRMTRTVQPDLGFESVKVARNDLATADVEVVLVKSGSRPARLSAECRGRLLRLWWDAGSRHLRRWGNTLW